MSDKPKQEYFLVSKAVSDAVFAYLLKKPCEETFELVTGLRNVHKFGDEGFILDKDLLTNILNYLLDQKARETISHILSLQRCKKFIPPDAPETTTEISDEDEKMASEGRSLDEDSIPNDTDVKLEKFNPEENTETK